MSAAEVPFREPDAIDVRKAVLSQLKGIVAAFVGIIMLGLIPIAGSWYASRLETWAIMLGWLALFVLAYLAQTNYLFNVAIRGRQQPADPPSARAVNYLTVIFMAIGAAGAVAVIYDFAILRNYGFTTSAATIRLEEVVASIKGLSTSSPISGAGRLAIPAYVPAIILLALYWRQTTQRTKAISGVAIAILLLEQFRFEGGRFFLTAVAGCAVLAAVLNPSLAAQRKNLLANTGLLVRLAVLGLILFGFFAYVFIARIADRDGFFWSAFINYANNFYIDVDRSSIQRFDGLFGGIWFSITMLWMYATQGLTEFDQIVRTAFFTHANGGYQFLQVTQITDNLIGTNWAYDRFANLPHMGTYVTLPGSFYIDFGASVATASGAMLGFLTARASWMLVSARLGMLALMAPIFLTIAYVASVVSLVQQLWPSLAWCLLMPLLKSQIEPVGKHSGIRSHRTSPAS